MKIHAQRTIISTINWNKDTTALSCFRNLDHLYELGFKKMECAANYPLCGIPEYFRHTENMLQEWITKSGINDLELYIRVGEVSNNLQNQAYNLSNSFLLMLGDDYINKFGNNLKCLIVSSGYFNNEDTIRNCIESLKYFIKKHLQIGFYLHSDFYLFMKLLKEENILPGIFLPINQYEDQILIENNTVSDIFIDASGVFKNATPELTGNYEDHIDNMLNSFERYNKNYHLPIDPGLVISLENASILDAYVNP